VIEDTTSADSVSNQTAIVEAVTVDSNKPTVADNETVTDAGFDVTTISLNDTETGNDTLWTTTIGIDNTI